MRRILLAGGTTLTCLAELEAATASNIINACTSRVRLNDVLMKQRRSPFGSKSSVLVFRGGAFDESSDDTDDESESMADVDETEDESGDDGGHSDSTEEEDDDNDDAESDGNETEEDNGSEEESNEAESSEEIEGEEPEESEPVVAATPSPTKTKKRRKIQQSSTDVQRKDGDNRPTVPPSALYRFWLTKGRVGHIIVAAMAITSEFATCYLPFLASFVTWLLKATGIYDAEKAIRVAEARRAAAMRGHAVGSPKRGRFGGNKRAQTARKKAADQVAVGKLRSLAGEGGAGGIARDSRYCHLSSSFMKRHALGPYSLEIDAKAARDGLVQDVVGESVAEHGEELVMDALKGKMGEVEAPDETEEEEDWVVQALSADQFQKEEVCETEDDLNSRERPYRVEPYVEIEAGSSGENSVSFGVDFTIGGPRRRPSTRDAMLKAAAESRSSIAGGRRRKVVGQRSSDRSGGGGVLGRIRAAGGDMIPARVLGAYPGDAAPIEEAGSANGLFALASRYGYGEWSDENDDDNDYEDDDDDNNQIGWNDRRRSRPKHRRRRRRSSSAQSGSGGSSPSNEQRKSSSEKRRRRSSSSSTGSRRRGGGHADTFRSTNTGWDNIFGTDNRDFCRDFPESSRQASMPRMLPTTPIKKSQHEDSNECVTPSVLLEKRRTGLSNTITRRPMERTHEKEKERQYS